LKKENYHMIEEISQVAERIKEMRGILGFTEEYIAEQLSIPAELYGKYERSGEDIPISVLYKLASIYRVDMTELLSGKSPRLSTLSVVRKGEGLIVERFAGYKYENIAHKFRHRHMEPMIVKLDPNPRKPEMVTHGGQELNFCLKGDMTLYYDGAQITLHPGDCAYFDPTRPHGQSAAAAEQAVFLTVIHE
jgi:transcriptional regulator with XRE-family HTH domain